LKSGGKDRSSVYREFLKPSFCSPGCVRGFLPKAVAEYLLNYKRDDLNAIETTYGLKIVIIGEEDMAAEESKLDFKKTEQSAVALIEKEDEGGKGAGERPWYRRLFPI